MSKKCEQIKIIKCQYEQITDDLFFVHHFLGVVLEIYYIFFYFRANMNF